MTDVDICDLDHTDTDCVTMVGPKVHLSLLTQSHLREHEAKIERGRPSAPTVY